MRVLTDENVHGKVVSALRARGYEVERIVDHARGVEDAAILMRADIGDRVFVTNDRDFGELIFREGQPAPFAILYTRTPHRDWQATSSLLIAELERGIAAGQIATITPDGVRRRAFPIGVSHG